MKRVILAVTMALVFSNVWANDIYSTTTKAPLVKQKVIYAGASYSALQNDCDLLEDLNLGCEGWKVFAGYKFNARFGVEAAYHKLLDESSGGKSMEYTASSLAAVSFMPIGARGEFFTKLGVASGDITASNRQDIGSGVIVLRQFSDNYTGLLAGIGAGYKLTPHLSIRGEYESIDGDKVLSAGLVGSF